MLVKLLSETDKHHLLDLAKLLALSDNPLLWDGKGRDEITSKTDINNISIQKVELEESMIAELAFEGRGKLSSSLYSYFSENALFANSVEARLIEIIKGYPLQKAEEPDVRVQVAIILLKELLLGKSYENPGAPKVMLYELMLLALRDGNISSIEWALLKEFQCHHKLEDFIFDDLLERAETMNKEVSKTISIILE